MSLNATTQPLSLAARMRKALPALPYSQSKLALPLTMDELEEEDDGFTDADLLLECTFAALWNAACLLYLLSDGRQLEWGTMNGFVAALVVLIALPLLIGLSAGSSAISGGYEVRRWMRVATRVAAGSCFFGFWALWWFAVCDQNLWLQLDTAAVTLCGQGILIYRSANAEGQIQLAQDEVDMHNEKIAFVWNDISRQ